MLLYFALGNPDAIDAGDARQRLGEPKIVAMVERLAKRMKANPDDAKGWALLGRSIGALQRSQRIRRRVREAAARLPSDADVSPTGPRQAMAQGRTLAGKPTEIVERALAIDPKTRKRWRSRRGGNGAPRRHAAIPYWNTLLAILPADSEQAREIAR